jgi:hypothetical protein
VGIEAGIGYDAGVSSHHRRYLLVEQGVGAALFNLVLNAAIAWALFRGMPRVPLWGQTSLMGDTIGTSMILPFLTCLIVTRIARGHVRAGHVAALEWTSTPSWLGWLPQRTLARAAILALAGVVVLAPLAALALGVAGIEELPLGRAVAFKAAFAAVAAAVVTPVVALRAIAERA